MSEIQAGSYICKDCLSFGIPVKIATKNADFNTLARATMYRSGLLGGFLLGYMHGKNRPLGCRACKSLNIVPVDTPMGKMLLQQAKQIEG